MKTTEEKVITPEEWIDEINEKAAARAQLLANQISGEVEPFVFVLTPLEDAAVGFFKLPDFDLLNKLLRDSGDCYARNEVPTLAARSCLLRELNGERVSDIRFMDENGEYASGTSKLNFNFNMRANKLIEIYQDSFKKK